MTPGSIGYLSKPAITAAVENMDTEQKQRLPHECTNRMWSDLALFINLDLQNTFIHQH
jgi:hypothetical protein